MRKYIPSNNRYRLNSANPGRLSLRSMPRYIKHSSNSTLPTFSIESVEINEIMSFCRDIMMKNDFNEICIVEQDTLGYYHISKTGDEFQVRFEMNLDVNGPLYGMNLNVF